MRQTSLHVCWAAQLAKRCPTGSIFIFSTFTLLTYNSRKARKDRSSTLLLRAYNLQQGADRLCFTTYSYIYTSMYIIYVLLRQPDDLLWSSLTLPPCASPTSKTEAITRQINQRWFLSVGGGSPGSARKIRPTQTAVNRGGICGDGGGGVKGDRRVRKTFNRNNRRRRAIRARWRNLEGKLTCGDTVGGESTAGQEGSMIQGIQDEDNGRFLNHSHDRWANT